MAYDEGLAFRIRDHFDDRGDDADADYVVSSHTELRHALGL
jgi:hypothetical protein